MKMNDEELLEEQEQEKEELTKEQKQLKQKITNRDLVIIGLIIIIILLLLMRGCHISPDITFLQPVKETSGEANVQKSNEQLYVTMPVITDITGETTLYCPEENEDIFEIAYSFTDAETKESIYQTQYLKAGERLPVNFKDFLPKGEHKVRVSITSRYADTQKAANGAGSTITITVY